MKLKHFQHLDAYSFVLTFENSEVVQADLKDLLSNYVTLDELGSARIDSDWGCLEFKNGMVDIEPKTLYQFVSGKHSQAA